MRKLVGFSALALSCLLAWSASAQPEWDANKGNCDDALQQPQDFQLSRVRTCVQIWETYRDVGNLSMDQRARYARGFSRLYYQGSAADRSLAQGALSRMGMDVLQEGDFLADDGPDPSQWQRDTTPIHVGDSSRRAQRRANSLNSDGLDAYNGGDYAGATRLFEQALQEDPWHVLAKYNLACNYSLLGRYDEAVRHLNELSRWDIPQSDERMARARVDEDFIPMRDDYRFRLITGYTRAQVLNGAGEGGLEAVAAVRQAFLDAEVDVSSYGYDAHTRVRPLVYYRPGYESTARMAESVLAHEETELRRIDWRSDFDVIVVYGDLQGAVATPLRPPVVQGTWDGTIIPSGDAVEAGEDAAGTAEDAAEAVEDPAGAAEEWVPPELPDL